VPRASSVSLGKYRRWWWVGSVSWRNARIDYTPPPQHQRITKHHICWITIPTRQIQSRTKKLMLSTRVWLVLPNSIFSQWGSLIDTSSLLQSLFAPAIDRIWALPPTSTLGLNLRVLEFRRSRHQRRWDPFVFGDTIMDNGYIGYTYIYIFK